MIRAPVLVTGSRGFFGRAIASELSARRVRPLTLAGRAEADLLSPSAVRALLARVRPRTIFHMAGSPGESDWGALWDAHVGATINLLEAVRALGAPVRVVLAGSAAEYGAAQGARPAREDGPAEPVGAYGAVKLSQTLAALSYQSDDLDVIVGRVFNASGPGCPARIVPGAFAAQLAEIENGAREPVLKTGDLRPRRDFVDIRDIARAFVALSSPGVHPGVYNIASGRPTRISDVLEALVAASRVRPRVERSVPKAAGVPISAGSPAKLSRACGWAPRVSLAQSLADTLDWCRR